MDDNPEDIAEEVVKYIPEDSGSDFEDESEDKSEPWPSCLTYSHYVSFMVSRLNQRIGPVILYSYVYNAKDHFISLQTAQ